MEKNINVRIATAGDAKALVDIYAPYVRNTAISFDYEVPAPWQFAERMQQVLKKYPYLLAEADGKVLGYAYAAPFKERKAYDWAVETTVYVHEKMRKMGIGRKLYEALEKILALQNILNLNACIACPLVEDEYLTRNSIYFHQRCGYRLVGEFYQCGYKFKRWYNMVWMEKHIGAHVAEQAPVRLFDEIKELIGREYGIK